MLLLDSEEPEDPSRDAQHVAQQGCSWEKYRKYKNKLDFFSPHFKQAWSQSSYDFLIKKNILQ